MTQAETVLEAPSLDSQSLKAQSLVDNMNRVLVGQSKAVRLTVIAFLAGGHALIEDVPGVGKTLLAKTLAMSVKARFKRVQCTPDLLPSDISGVNVYHQKEGTFNFIPGPIFTNILLADEINRATPRTQSSLLEAMEEHQVTTDGVTRKLPDLFFLIATENPIEYHGTFPLPEAQLDRFTLCISLGYPDANEEVEILDKTLQERAFTVEPVLSMDDVIEARHCVRKIFVEKSIKRYIVDIIHQTRNHSLIALGVSPRGGQLLMLASQAAAFLEGRNFVKPEDVKQLCPHILGHRIIPKLKDHRVSHGEIIECVLEEVKVPV